MERALERTLLIGDGAQDAQAGAPPALQPESLNLGAARQKCIHAECARCRVHDWHRRRRTRGRNATPDPPHRSRASTRSGAERCRSASATPRTGGTTRRITSAHFHTAKRFYVPSGTSALTPKVCPAGSPSSYFNESSRPSMRRRVPVCVCLRSKNFSLLHSLFFSAERLLPRLKPSQIPKLRRPGLEAS